MSSQPKKPPRSRASTRKVRTGCITCKKRHVKCDEEKPYCHNCLRYIGKCEGYAPLKDEVYQEPLEISWDSREICFKQSDQGRGPDQLYYQPSLEIAYFRNEPTKRYYDEFVNLVQGPWMANGAYAGFWEVTFTQLAHNNDIFRHAAVAIGAMSMWHSQSPQKLLRSAMTCPDRSRNVHYLNATAHYCQSLKLLYQRASTQDALLLSILLMYFELLRGHRKAALHHVNHGLAILLDIMTDKNVNQRIALLGPNPKPIISAVADAFTHLAAQSQTILHGRLGEGRPFPNFSRGLKASNQTLQSFMVMLDHHVYTSTTWDDTPSSFNSLAEFDDYLLAAKKRRMTLAPVSVEILRDSRMFGSNDQANIYNFFSAMRDDVRVRKFQQETDDAKVALDAAFKPVFDRAIMSDLDSTTYFKALHLRLRSLGSNLYEHPSQVLDHQQSCALTPAANEYLSLAEMAISRSRQALSNPAHHLSLQSTISWKVFHIGMFCRDALTRDRAILILREYPGHDGLVNTRTLYVSALKNRLVEHDNMIEGTVDEQWVRLWRREIVFEEAGERVRFRYLEKDKITGVWRPVDALAKVAENPEDTVWERRVVDEPGKTIMEDLLVI